jgi:RNA polymerase sigma-32 factor
MKKEAAKKKTSVKAKTTAAKKSAAGRVQAPKKPIKTRAVKKPVARKAASMPAKAAKPAAKDKAAKKAVPAKPLKSAVPVRPSKSTSQRKPAKTQIPFKATPGPKAAKKTSPEKPSKPSAPIKSSKTTPKGKPVKAPEAVKAARRPKSDGKPMAAPPPVTEARPAEKQEKPIIATAEKAPAKAVKPLKSAKKEKDQDSDKALVKFDPLQRYLSEISKYRLLTRDEERDLGTRVKEQGDKEAAYALVTANLRLVVKIALEFQRVWMQNLLDLIQEGNIGLMQAVKKFDPYKNVKFSYYASFWIKAYILKFIMDNWRLVKIGTTQGQRKLFFKLKKEKQRLIEQGFDPKPKLLSERLGVSEREIVDMDQRLDGWDVSLDAPLKNDSETERIEFLSTESESIEDQVSKKEIELLLHNKINEFRKKMSPREIEIFELRIFSDNPVTLQDIGDRYGISRERVRQIEKNIIRKMRDFFKHEIPDFASYSDDTGME